MSILKKYLLIFSLLSCLHSEAQIKHMFDTIWHDVKTKRKGFFLSLDGKNSIIRDLELKMFGLQGGYLHNKRTNFYVGLYSTLDNKSRVYRNPTSPDGSSDSNTIYSTYGVAYWNFGCEYYFYNSKKWRLSLIGAQGMGVGWDRLFNSKNVPLEQKNSLILPVEIAFSANYKLQWWVWLGAGIGTRISLAASQYNGPFFTYGIQLKTGEIYRRTKKFIKSL